MKNRVIFMIMNRVLLDDLKSKKKETNNPDLDILSQNSFRWDEDLPSEECLWNLEQYLRSRPSNTQPSDGPSEGGYLPTSPSNEHSTTGEHRDRPRDISIPTDTFEFSKPEEILNKLYDVRNEHIHTSSLNIAFIFISWIILLLSLPATVAGYIGCFTLVSGSRGNGPLIWLLLEAGLSIIRILVWAWNPIFDERIGTTARLKPTDHQPLVTTEKDIEVIEQTGENTLSLVPERQFLEWITSYPGPLEQFQTSENFALYFTLTGTRAEQKRLYLTVFDVNKRNAVTLHWEEWKGFKYIDSVVTYNNIASGLQATLQSAIGKDHPWRRTDATLLDALSDYYSSIINALNHFHLQSTTPNNSQTNRSYMVRTIPMHLFRLPPANNNTQSEPRSMKTALIRWKWHNESPTIRKPLSLTEHDKLYLQRGYEHHLKTKLVEKWSRCIVGNMNSIRSDAQYDCYHALTDRTSEKAKWELTELDMQLAFEWTRREWSLVVSSSELECILHRRKEECINQIVKERENGPLGEWMHSEFVVGRQKRLEKEREQARERMKEETKVSAERAESEGRAWGVQEIFSPERMWEAGQKFIDKQWRAIIESKKVALPSDLGRLVKRITTWSEDRKDEARRTFVEQVRGRFKHWQHQRRNEKDEMDAIVERISNADTNHLDDAYQYPEWDSQTTHKFVELWRSQSVAKFCSATLYDVSRCDDDPIYDVIQKKTTRSVIYVPSHLVDSIPENNHLLYLSSKGGQEPPFVQWNRDRWWDQQTSNSSTFYFSSQMVSSNYVYSHSHTIAHIFIFLQTRTCLRLHLLHRRENRVSVSIQEKDNEVRFISADEISEQLRLQDFELNWFEPGRHELQLVIRESEESGQYFLRDILVEFFENLSSHSSGDLKGGDPQT